LRKLKLCNLISDD